MKKLFLGLVAVLLCVSLCSCGITDLFGRAGVTANTGHTKAASTTADPASTSSSTPTREPMDFTKIDVSQYITIPYQGLELTSTKEIREITDELVNQELTDILIRFGYYSLQSSGITSSGDTLEISYTGIMDGKTLFGGSNDKDIISLDEEDFTIDYWTFSGFAAGLIGKNLGETVDLILNFPENTQYAGKAVTFRVTIKGICQAQMTDASVNALSSGKYPTVTEYKAFLKEYMAAQDRLVQFQDVYNQIFNKMMELAEVKSYPDEQVLYYYEDIVAFISEQAKASNQSYDSLLKSMGYTDEDLRKEAENYTKSDLMIAYVAQKENVVVTDEVYKAYLQEMVESYNAQGYSYTAEIIENFYNTYYGEGYLRTQAQQEKVADAVYNQAHVTYDPNYGNETDSSAIAQ